jgi:LysR family transcriptional regulator, transcriptional activator of nhaA
MEWLNYHHLHYFWMVAREGTIARASQQLRLAEPTISGQIRQLEAALGERLFTRKGRSLVLTDVGQIAYRYADEIFALGRELADTLKGLPNGRPIPLMVGIADVLPKPIVRLLLEPALRLPEPVRIVCREDRSVDGFLAELALHSLDVLLTDAPATHGTQVRAFSHLLGECGTTFFASSKLATSLRPGFPESLNGAPVLLPSAHSAIRRVLDQWFQSQALRPTIVGEFDDTALMNIFGEDGSGLFAAPTVLEDELRRLYRVQVIGRAETLRQRFYAISVERRLKHPAVVAICESARRDLFA